MHLNEGTLLQNGKYRIARFIKSGGFGCTYEGVQSLLGARIAIKEFFVSDFCNREENNTVSVGTKSKVGDFQKLRQSFIKEASVLYQMQHPHIVRVIDVFEENGTAYYVMDYIEGSSLDELVSRKGKLEEKEAVDYILQVCDALKYVHSQNRMHMDVKPGNIMLNKNGKVVLIDFGTSKYYDEETGEQTSTLMGVYTRGYSPLEQISRSFKKFNPATDIYALGATLYKLLTGTTPPDSLLLLSRSESIEPLPSSISLSTRNAVEAAMQLFSDRRPQSVEEFENLLTKKEKEEEENIVDENTFYELPEESKFRRSAKSKINGHEYVDLGLPSGLKWATCNVGASTPEGYGDYFAWGEISPKSEYTKDNSETFGKDNHWLMVNNYIRPNGNLQLTHDAAHKINRGSWRMPTKAEIEELKNNTTMRWVTQNGINGRLFTSRINRNSIFLPATGWRQGKSLDNAEEYGDYWSSTSYDENSEKSSNFYFAKGNVYSGWSYRFIGRAIRPVSDENTLNYSSNF